jgi:internalin A
MSEVAKRRIAEVREEKGTSLDLMDCGLSSIPAEVFELTWLAHLDLDGNGLTQLPPEIGQLNQLETLDARNNQLSALPPEIAQLQSLQSLALSSNQLNALPREFADLNLVSWDFDDNPWSEPVRAALERTDLDDLKAYLHGLAVSEKCYETKLVLVGEGNVGKTSLVAAFQHEEFVENRSTTHGIEIRTIEVDHPSEAGIRIRMNTWDFGGQPVYRVTHQFFFSPRSLFLVVWWPREGVEVNDVEG